MKRQPDKGVELQVVDRVYRVHYTHTRKTIGGDVVTTGILSTWKMKKDAERAELRAWAEYGWDKAVTKTHVRGEDVLKEVN